MGKEEQHTTEEWISGRDLSQPLRPLFSEKPKTLAEVAHGLRLRLALVNYHQAGKITEESAKAAFNSHFLWYRALGGTDFELSESWVANVRRLLDKCQEADPGYS
ncbi:hypothetical protein ACFL3F_03600 [Planctomycetota bacterium]